MSLILFMALALTGIGPFGVAPTLTKDGKLLPQIEIVSENNNNEDEQQQDELKN